MLTREGLFSSKFYCENKARAVRERQLQECPVIVKISENSEFSRSNREFYTRLRLQLQVKRKPLGNETMRRLTLQTSADDEQLREFPNLPALERPNPALKVSPG